MCEWGECGPPWNVYQVVWNQGHSIVLFPEVWWPWLKFCGGTWPSKGQTVHFAYNSDRELGARFVVYNHVILTGSGHGAAVPMNTPTPSISVNHVPVGFLGGPFRDVVSPLLPLPRISFCDVQWNVTRLCGLNFVCMSSQCWQTLSAEVAMLSSIFHRTWRSSWKW